ncbi:MAG: hypothetical protein PHH23_06685 [Paludibacteraceae bacterium]|nr:hypothetical protein [Paludibacteraceae bacterium]
MDIKKIGKGKLIIFAVIVILIIGIVVYSNKKTTEAKLAEAKKNTADEEDANEVASYLKDVERYKEISQLSEVEQEIYQKQQEEERLKNELRTKYHILTGKDAPAGKTSKQLQDMIDSVNNIIELIDQYVKMGGNKDANINNADYDTESEVQALIDDLRIQQENERQAKIDAWNARKAEVNLWIGVISGWFKAALKDKKSNESALDYHPSGAEAVYFVRQFDSNIENLTINKSAIYYKIELGSAGIGSLADACDFFLAKGYINANLTALSAMAKNVYQSGKELSSIDECGNLK